MPYFVFILTFMWSVLALEPVQAKAVRRVPATVTETTTAAATPKSTSIFQRFFRIKKQRKKPKQIQKTTVERPLWMWAAMAVVFGFGVLSLLTYFLGGASIWLVLGVFGVALPILTAIFVQ